MHTFCIQNNIKNKVYQNACIHNQKRQAECKNLTLATKLISSSLSWSQCRKRDREIEVNVTIWFHWTVPRAAGTAILSVTQESSVYTQRPICQSVYLYGTFIQALSNFSASLIYDHPNIIIYAFFFLFLLYL